MKRNKLFLELLLEQQAKTEIGLGDFWGKILAVS